MISPNISLCEIAATFSRAGYTEKSIKKLLLTVQKFISFENTDDYLDEAINAAIRCKIRGADATFVGLAYSHDCELATLDVEQQNRSSEFIKIAKI